MNVFTSPLLNPVCYEPAPDPLLAEMDTIWARIKSRLPSKTAEEAAANRADALKFDEVYQRWLKQVVDPALVDTRSDAEIEADEQATQPERCSHPDWALLDYRRVWRDWSGNIVVDDFTRCLWCGEDVY